VREIQSWRGDLVRDLARRNPGIAAQDVNFAAQRTLGRLLFLRIGEDRGIEPYGRLQNLARKPNLSQRLGELFDRAGELSPELTIDDGPLGEIVAKFYDPASPYEFSRLPAEILGQIYEQSLGKATGPTKSGQARWEEQPKARKAGGVYYTPAHLVEHIVNHAVGRLLNGERRTGQGEGRTATGLTPGQVKKLRILDPACGSGSLLLGAYQYLLDWHRDWHIQHEPEQHARGRCPVLCRSEGGPWRLTAAARRRILLDNICGVDIDPQAVEVTKLSLLLKLMEGGPDETTANRRSGFPQQALADLAHNIKCGNALVGPDFEGQSPEPCDGGHRKRLRAFDWAAEFPEISKAGGFDAVIGNPPWGQKEAVLDEAAKAYLRKKYASLAGILDLFRPFVEQGIRLLKHHGMFGMVLPDIVLLKDYAETRLFMLDNLTLTDLRWWGMSFDDAVIDTATVLGKREQAPEGHLVHVRVDDRESPLDHEIPQSDFLANPRYTFNLHLTRERRAIVAGLGHSPRMGDFFEFHEGVHSGNMRSELFVDSRLDESCRPMYFGRDEIAPYHLHWEGRYLRLGAVPRGHSGKRYARLGRPSWQERSKVLIRRTGDRVLAAVDRRGFYASNNFFLAFPKVECSLDLDGLCALLNSRFLTWYFRTIEPRKGRVFSEIKIKHLARFPLPFAVDRAGACGELNSLGKQYATVADSRRQTRSHTAANSSRAIQDELDRLIDAWVVSSISADPELATQINAMIERK
jgi:hypothetical protein